jgi:hypothetical protein
MHIEGQGSLSKVSKLEPLGSDPIALNIDGAALKPRLILRARNRQRSSDIIPRRTASHAMQGGLTGEFTANACARLNQASRPESIPSSDRASHHSRDVASSLGGDGASSIKLSIKPKWVEFTGDSSSQGLMSWTSFHRSDLRNS